MKVKNDQPTISTFRGVLLGHLDHYDPETPDRAWTLSNGRTVFPCLIPSAVLLHSLLSQPLDSFRFQLADWYADDNNPEPLPVVTDAQPDEINRALYQLPENICPVEGVYVDTLDLIDQIKSAPLHDLVSRVFVNRDICARYWTMPASAKHHHAWAGGLATHSLEVATDLAQQSVLADHERELGIAGGLLHDIGKVWAYTDDMFPNTANRAMGHELIGLSRLERELKVLESHWPDGGYAMRVLLSGCGRMRPNGSMPSALVARIKAADQRSCEAERNSKDPSQTWKPGRWLPTPPPDIDPTHLGLI